MTVRDTSVVGMAFLRRRGESPSSARPDAVFPQLAAPDTAWIRQTAHRVLTDNGLEVALEADGATFVAADGYRITLDNVVATCTRLPREQWGAYIADHYRQVARSVALPAVGDLSIDEIRTRIRTRLIPPEALSMAGVDMSAYARPVADGLWAVLCVDFPHVVSYVSSEDAAALPDLDGLFRLAQANTDAEPIDRIEHLADDIVAVSGDSVFVASTVLNPAALVARTMRRDAPNGVVFIVPDRSRVLLHVIDDVFAVEAMESLAAAAPRMYADATYSISPLVYYWHRSSITRISDLRPDGTSILVPSPDLVEVMRHLDD